MKKREYLLLFVLTVVFYFCIAIFQKVPGYMDAEYYYSNAIGLSEKIIVEPFIWNYLGQPSRIEVPIFSYWMPFTSILAYLGLLLSKAPNFLFARIPFIFSTGIIAVSSAYLAEKFIPGKRSGWISGGLALFSGAYLPYLSITDTFLPFMTLGGLFFVLSYHILNFNINSKKQYLYLFLLGFLIGLMHLTRSDGILWLGAGILVIYYYAKQKQKAKKILRNFFKDSLVLFSGYLLPMIIWYIRNLFFYESLFPEGNRFTFFLTSYKDMFIFPAEMLTKDRLFMYGWDNILQDRILSSVKNIETLIYACGGIILVPLIVLAWKKNYQNPIIKILGILATLIFILMSFVFPYAGERGGFFHSISSIQVLIWSLVPAGLFELIQFGIKKRNWKLERAWKMFGSTLIIVMCIFSAFIFFQKMTSSNEKNENWNHSLSKYDSMNDMLTRITNDGESAIMVNNPPGFYLATNRRAIMIPTGGVESIIKASKTFESKYILIDDERIEDRKLLEAESKINEIFLLIFTNEEFQIYEIK